MTVRRIVPNLFESAPDNTRDFYAGVFHSCNVLPDLMPAKRSEVWHLRTSKGLVRRSGGFNGLRPRVLASFVVVMLLSIVASLLFIRGILLARLDAEVDAQINQEAREFASLVGGVDPDTSEPFGDDVEAIADVYFDRNFPDEGEELVVFIGREPYRARRAHDALYSLEDLPEFVDELEGLEEPRSGEVETPEGTALYRAVPVVIDGDALGSFVVANFPAAEREEINEVIQVSIAVMLGVLLLAGMIGWIAAGRALRPLRELSDATRSINEGDLNLRIEANGNDEVAELTRRFNSMLRRLDEAFAAQRRLVDDAGHELRTPLTVIRGHIEMQRDGYATSDETNPVVLDELERMERMVGDLLTLAKVERPHFLRFELVDVGQLTEEFAAKAEALGDRDWRLDKRGSGMIEVDRQRVTQAWLQLIQNAIQHTQERDVISFGSDVLDGQARFWVRDTGPGVPPDEQEAIFGRFRRGSDSRQSDGAGLGLSIVAAITAAHSGRVEVSSEVGQGALFTLILPADRRPP